MKKLFAVIVVLFIFSLSTFAQPVVTLNKELSTPSQNMVVGENGLINGAKVVYDITTSSNINLTDLSFFIYGPINNISLRIGSTIIASKQIVNQKVNFNFLNTIITSNNKLRLEVYLSYSGIGTTNYVSGSTAQIKMTLISYVEGSSAIGMNLENTGLSPLMCLVSKLPELFIEGRPVGANTYITIPLNVIGEGILDRFQLNVAYKENSFMPFDFWASSIFYDYDNSWILPSSYFDGDKLNFAAVGNTVYLYNQAKLGTFKMFVSDNVKEITSNINMFDGVNIWKNNISPFKVINVKMEEYNDLNNDSKYNVNDSRIIFDMLGTKPNDIDMVKADLNGDGMLLTYDTYLSLGVAMNQSSFYDLPIFGNDIAFGKIIPKDPIVINWKKLSNGQYGAFASEKITNGDFVLKNNAKISGYNGMFKQMENKAFSVNPNHFIKDPIFTAKTPTEFYGTVNEGRQIVVNPYVVTDIEENNEIPTEFKLEQNYPNPFNPTTEIKFTLSSTSLVTLNIYDITGKEIATLVNEEKTVGTHSVQFNASGLASGTYIYRLTVNGKQFSNKMILMK